MAFSAVDMNKGHRGRRGATVVEDIPKDGAETNLEGTKADEKPVDKAAATAKDENFMVLSVIASDMLDVSSRFYEELRGGRLRIFPIIVDQHSSGKMIGFRWSDRRFGIQFSKVLRGSQSSVGPSPKRK